MRRRPITCGLALAALLGLAAAAPAATDYSYIKTGTYSVAGRVPAYNAGTESFPASAFTASFRVTAAKRKGPRTLRSFKLGPSKPLCVNRTAVPYRYAQRSLPQLAGFPPIGIPGGFIIRSYVLRAGHWKAGKVNVRYSGPLPNIYLQSVYNRSPSRFNANPMSEATVDFQAKVDDAGKFSASGAWDCQLSTTSAFRKR